MFAKTLRQSCCLWPPEGNNFFKAGGTYTPPNFESYKDKKQCVFVVCVCVCVCVCVGRVAVKRQLNGRKEGRCVCAVAFYWVSN